MKKENLNKTILKSGVSWHKEDDGTYVKVATFMFKDGTMDYEIMESDVSEKEYFKKVLEGKDKAWFTRKEISNG